MISTIDSPLRPAGDTWGVMSDQSVNKKEICAVLTETENGRKYEKRHARNHELYIYAK